jgi:hypothetical protein
MRDEELLAICQEFYSLGEDGIYLKKWRRGFPRSAVGNRVGNTHHSGYKYVKINNKLYGEHRLVWLMIHGVFPDGELDHEDGDCCNNTISNLRLATRGRNCANRNGWSESGYKGVYPTKRGKPWQAQITVDKKSILLGRYDNKEDAARAYDIAALKYKGEFAKINFTGETV